MSSVDERIHKLISRRSWEKLSVRWLDDIPTINPPGTPPESCVADVPGLPDLGLKIFHQAKLPKGENDVVTAFEELPLLRKLMFHEAVYLLHKARHLLGAAEFHARDGLRTCSLSTGYQSALLSAKAISALLGIYVVEVENRTLVIDVFPGVAKDSAQYVRSAFYFRGHKFDHKATWELFQRVAAVSSVEDSVWPKSAISKLRVVDVKDFSKQRNQLLYNNIAWMGIDLNDFDLSSGFGDILYWGKSNKDINFDRKDISLVLALYVLKLGLALLQDIETVSKKLSNELNILAQCIVKERHPVYAKWLKF